MTFNLTLHDTSDSIQVPGLLEVAGPPDDAVPHTIETILGLLEG